MTASGGLGQATALTGPMAPLMPAGCHRPALHIPAMGYVTRRSV
jgi:hypothetical protein